MSAYEQIQSTAEGAILELEAEIGDLEEKIEFHKNRIQGARVQIQALKRFLCPDENGQGQPALDNGALSETVLEMLTELHPQSVHYKDLTDLITQKGHEIPGKQPERAVLNCLMKLTKAGKAKNAGKGYYEAITCKEDRALRGDFCD